MTARLVDRDLGMQRLLETARALPRRVRLEVGVFIDAGERIVERALAQEFGTSVEPAQSFVRAYVDAHRDAIRRDMTAAATALLTTSRSGAVSQSAIDSAFNAIARRIADGVRALTPRATGELAGSIEGRVARGAA